MLKRFSLLFFCLLSQVACAVKVIHIAPYRFKRSQEKGIREVLYSIQSRKILQVSYYKNLSKICKKYGINISQGDEGERNSYDVNGSSVILTGPLSKRVICTNLPIDLDEYGYADNYEKHDVALELGGHQYVSSTEIEGKSAEDIKNILSDISSDGRSMALGAKNIIYKHSFNNAIREFSISDGFKNGAGFGNLSGDQKDNSDERGLLGELGADLLTLFGFGCSRLTTKHGGNCGWDGVYTIHDDEGLLFMESKNTKTGSAKKHFDSDYLSPKDSPLDNKKKINFLKKLDDLEYYGEGLQTNGSPKPELLKTRKKIIAFLTDKKPIFLFLYRVMYDGSTGGRFVDVDDQAAGELARDSLLIALNLKNVPKPVTPIKINLPKDANGQIDVARLKNAFPVFSKRMHELFEIDESQLSVNQIKKRNEIFMMYKVLGSCCTKFLKDNNLQEEPNAQAQLGLDEDVDLDLDENTASTSNNTHKKKRQLKKKLPNKPIFKAKK